MDLRTTSNAAAAPKIPQPFGLSSGGPLAALLLSHRALRLCSFVAPCQPLARKPAHPVPIYEMGSSERLEKGVSFRPRIARIGEQWPRRRALANPGGY